MKHYAHPDYSYINIVEVAKSEVHNFDFAACAEPKETLGSYYNRQVVKPDVLINAGFFAMTTGVPCFNTIDEGEVRSTSASYKTGMGTKTGKTDVLVFGNVDDGSDWLDFLSAYPVLLEGNGPISTFTYATEINYNATRSCLAFNDDTVFVVHIGRPGMTFKNMSTMLHNLGATYAINLDGGGSARLMYNGEVVGTPTENRSVDNVFAIYLNSDTSEDTTSGTVIAPDTAYISYTVVSGDSWWKIASEQLGSGLLYVDLMEFNNVTTSLLTVGQVIKIPVDEYEYTVVSGDSWWGIAAKEMGSGLKYTELAEYNGTDSSYILHPGDVIKIPV